MPPEMKNYGWAAASDFLGDRIVYRNLVPFDLELPGLGDLASSFGIPSGRIPRKHELDYARVVARLLNEARVLENPQQPITRLVFIGDTELLDGTGQRSPFLTTQHQERPEEIVPHKQEPVQGQCA